MSPRIAYNDKEVDLLARLIRSEALGEGQEGMLLVGNVVVNRVAVSCDVFRNVTTITEAVYQKNAFAGVNTPLFNGPINALDRELALRTINGYRNAPATYALWFKNPGVWQLKLKKIQKALIYALFFCQTFCVFVSYFLVCCVIISLWGVYYAYQYF